MSWWWLAVLFPLAASAYMNHFWYARIWGRPLRLRYFWAAHGAVLWGRRLPRWEADRPRQVPEGAFTLDRVSDHDFEELIRMIDLPRDDATLHRAADRLRTLRDEGTADE